MARELVRKALLGARLPPVQTHKWCARARLGSSAHGAPCAHWVLQRALTRSIELRGWGSCTLRRAFEGHSLAAGSAPFVRCISSSPSPSSPAASCQEAAQHSPPSTLPDLSASAAAGSNPMECSNGVIHASQPVTDPFVNGTPAAHPGTAAGTGTGPSPERKKARTLETPAEAPIGVPQPPDARGTANGCAPSREGQGAEQPATTSGATGAEAVPGAGAAAMKERATPRAFEAEGSPAESGRAELGAKAPDVSESAPARAGAGLEAPDRGPVGAEIPSPEGALRRVPVPHAEAAWAHFRALGSPQFHVAPMVDQSELPFRMLCRKYGTTAAYTPMLHSRLFAEEPKYRLEFTTCPEDRPLFVQFCANNPETLVKAASLVAHQCDYIDLNFGCPQRIAKKGNYGAFLMDNLPLVRSLVETLAAARLPALVSCKIRVFPDAERTLEYARMIEAAGCSLLAVHGRTREQKDQRAIRADWGIIRQVKDALSIPVLANGNVRTLDDARACLEATGADGVLSAESLLANPALFGGYIIPEHHSNLPGHATQGSSQGQGLQLDGAGVEREAHSGAAGPEAGRAPGVPGLEAMGAATGAASCHGLELEAGELRGSPGEAGMNGSASAGGGHPETCNGLSGAGSRQSVADREGLKEGPVGVYEVDGVRMADPVGLSLEYLELCAQYPVPMRMVRAHLHRMLGGLFGKHPQVREKLNKEYRLTLPWLKDLVLELDQLRNTGSIH